eukprot:CAMPEP_0204561470 /NCGR_PEP_ID=MMETSP0661-20131031/33204_1 /ASSEMBLY_ACC=CAM_ASM_000606 /TAXON_ID=109239 /ORGANISM="Alexandrium margalefi, Strain AMGDE01CS-322" /LENGTH=68 /DNA_ID=CAMNT_0051568881 /DNA_START=226 /DNA_END=430 /DNA_ORIENTATION=-
MPETGAEREGAPGGRLALAASPAARTRRGAPAPLSSTAGAAQAAARRAAACSALAAWQLYATLGFAFA